jgi:Tol biopolymer transport system component
MTSCSAGRANPVNPLLSKPSLFPSPSATFTPSPLPGPTKTPTQNIVPLSVGISPIHFAIGFNYLDMRLNVSSCNQVYRNQISVFSSENVLHQFLLNDINTDYSYPTWSSDGKWIAFVVSKPFVRSVDLTDTPYSKGSDSIWIARPDGSDLHQIGESIPSEIVSSTSLGFLDCSPSSGIQAAPTWSPDGKYISFVCNHCSKTDEDGIAYYLIDTESGKMEILMSNLLIGSMLAGAPTWIDNRTLVYEEFIPGGQWGWGNRAGIKIITGIGTTNKQVNHYPYPANLSWQDRQAVHGFYAYHGNQTLMSVTDNPSSSSPGKTQVWSFSVSTHAWAKLAILDGSGIGMLSIGNHFLATCNTHKPEEIIYVYNTTTWQSGGIFTLPEDAHCDSIEVSTDAAGMDYGYVVSTNDNIARVFRLDLSDPKASPEILFDDTIFPWMNSREFIDIFVDLAIH